MHQYTEMQGLHLQHYTMPTYQENPDYMLDLSKRLERRNGHKPTYEELIDYIDHEAFHLKTDDEINQEIQELVNNIRKNK